MRARTERYQTNIRNDIKIYHQFDEQSMQHLCSKKWCKKHTQSSTFESKKEPKTKKTPSQTDHELRYEKKKWLCGGRGVHAADANEHLQIQQNSLLVTCMHTEIEGTKVLLG